MARIVAGKPPFVGTRDNLTIYQMNGEYIVRTKSSLTGKRVKRDPAFAKTMENAGRLKQASGIASCVYKQMPVNERVYKQYRELVGKAMCLLKESLDIDHVVFFLEATYLPDKSKDNNSCADKSSAKPFVKRVKKRTDNNRHSIALYRSFERECADNRRRNRSGGRFQVGIAGLRLFDTRLMRLYRYSKAHTLENAP